MDDGKVALKEAGYKWNPETRSLKKLPKFNVGDVIVKKNSITNSYIVNSVSCDYYGLIIPNNTGIGVLKVDEQDEWELVPNKFDINTLVPFESRVLVRDEESLAWRPAIFGLYKPQIDKDFPFIVVGGVVYTYCIPYEGNQHLIGTTNDCDDFYKTWEK